jgi:tRNA threonylcarbamoyladenosine biosynthesis protein TsaB
MNKARLLAIDTATEACSAALYIDGEIQQKYELAPREHTRLILKMIESLLADAELKINQLDALAFGCGPGSFTGVRIATGVVQGLGFATDLPVVPVSTLASIAQLVHDQHQAEKVLSAIDARMGGVYWAEYKRADYGLMQLSGSEEVLTPEQTPEVEGNDWIAAGSGWKGHSELLLPRFGQNIQQVFEDALPQSSTIAKLAVAAFHKGEAVEAKYAMPVYLRNNVAKKSQK